MYHTVILTLDGAVWTGGGNYYGALGLGDTTNRSFFTKIVNSGAIDIAASVFSTHILIGDAVFGCGWNTYGELGDGTTTQRNSLVAAVGHGTSGVSKLHKGVDGHLLVLKSGSVYACGFNPDGQLGIGVAGNRTTLTPCIGAASSGVTDIFVGSTNESCILKSGVGYICGYLPYTYGGWTGSVRSSSYRTSNWIAWSGEGSSGVDDVKLGSGTIILKSGKLWATGTNNYGELGLGFYGHSYTNWVACVGDGSSGVSSIANAAFDSRYTVPYNYLYTFMVKNNKAYYTGDSQRGQAGFGVTHYRTNQFVQVPGLGSSLVTLAARGSDFSVLVRQGKVYTAGRNNLGQQLNGVIDSTMTSYTSFHTTVPL